ARPPRRRHHQPRPRQRRPRRPRPVGRALPRKPAKIMTMKLLFVIDPTARLQIAGDSTFALMLAAQARNHEIWFCEPRHLCLEHADAVARAWPVTVRRVAGDHYLLGPQAVVPLRSCQAVLMRK